MALHSPGEVPQGDTIPGDFDNEVDDDDPNNQLEEACTQRKLVGRSLGGLIKVLLL